MGAASFLQRLVRGDQALAERAASRAMERVDRQALVQSYIPAVAREGGRILWVGCRDDTALLYAPLEAHGGEVWTLDSDRKAFRWGRKGRHATGDLSEADRLFDPFWFTSIICDRLLGYGFDLPSHQGRALGAMSRILKPGGRLVLGWNKDRIQPPVEVGMTEPWYVPQPFAGLPAQVRFEDSPHVYDSLIRR